MLSLLRKKTKLYTDPYPHIIVENALPDDLYDRLEREWPTKQLLATAPHDNGVCFRLKSDEMLKPGKVSALWQQFTDYHTSIQFYNEVQSVFSDYIKHDSPGLGPRGWAKKTDHIWTDCQTVMHRPVETTTRSPHIDNPREIYAGLFYMPYADDNCSGGDFTLYRARASIKEVDLKKGREIFSHDLGVPVKTVPYKRNTLVMFLNRSAECIHGVTPRENATKHRRSVNIIAEYSRSSKKSMYSVKEK